MVHFGRKVIPTDWAAYGPANTCTIMYVHTVQKHVTVLRTDTCINLPNRIEETISATKLLPSTLGSSNFHLLYMHVHVYRYTGNTYDCVSVKK